MDRRAFLSAAMALPVFGRLQRDLDDRLGASTACLAGRTLSDALTELRRLKFQTVEIIAYTGARHSVGDIPGFDYAAATSAERDRAFAATRSFRHISAHLPFHDVKLFSTTDDDRRAGVERLQHAMDGLAFLRGELAVMHIGWPPKGARFRDIWQPMVDTLRGLGDYAAARRLKLGIETMQPDSIQDYAELLEAVNHPHVGATIDTGHIRGATDIGLPADRRDTDEARERFNDVLNRLVTMVGRRVFHVHVSDVRRSDWADHREIGTGIVDFPRFFAALRAIAYGGLLVFELEEPDTLGALLRSRTFVNQASRRP